MQPAQNEKQWRKICSAEASTTPFVRSLRDWQTARRFGLGMIPKASKKSIEQLEKSLTFRNGGLAHAEYGLLQKELSKAELRKFFELFGIGSQYFDDHNGYACVSRATCATASGSICTSNC